MKLTWEHVSAVGCPQYYSGDQPTVSPVAVPDEHWTKMAKEVEDDSQYQGLLTLQAEGELIRNVCLEGDPAQFPWTPTAGYLGDKPEEVPLQEWVGQALGAASMCWRPRPTGEFDSRAAGRIFDALMTEIERASLERTLSVAGVKPELLAEFAGWLDSQGLIVPESPGDERTHEDLAEEFMKQAK